ncbi:DUF2500 domain-containing protein [Photobacterium sanguinicancri]|uniref:DUF2500 domain-containing protein n=1 Tax=Photobacterium sanguinicancri TaxID=875932 RepID=A0AAW7Y611_9GAMM|nr:DUF2500 domain-containing protein [Photobacterium sanguinicancri]KXI23944.1 RNA polymerase subunit sigma [Photobacterium sanguinicancri]MDO6499465.1 DUF2500 domain-containing protein [Photobacterium sanguinicancri]MDO6543206.1 DUF2500 domain-containing protein [Photobacterium sanguinicancri]OZS44703.1 DUF2500 domain-containing protein [Photobacterium sanguinicancri]
MPFWIPLALLAALAIAISYFLYSYRRHSLGLEAPEKKVEVCVLDKQSNPIIGAQPGDDNEEYWIYVEPTEGGPRREFMVGIHYFQALNPGDQGIMTYRGRQFLHFALQRD